MLVHGMTVLHDLIYYMDQTRYQVWDMGNIGGIVHGKNTARGMVCDDGMVREKHGTWYGTFWVWYHGTVPRM